ncbi:MAG: carbamoyltransferase HypF, partial [Desulfocapsaceae bacterium]|nr:carbamoyltransferase HypF [Desulfocapsaceae bacterium]
MFLQYSPVKNSRTRRKSLQNGVEILVRGTVQGVGFRPFIFNLAGRLSISGTVTNTGDGVVIRACGRDEDLYTFLDSIYLQPPPLSRITGLFYHHLEELFSADAFTIIASQSTGSAHAQIPPDIAICRDCLEELSNPDDFRFNYPFINCTNCGPRFTITESIPYDRPKTSMKVFPMCARCAVEYKDPANRRFHAQPNACAGCGPAVSWHDGNGSVIDCTDVISAAVSSLCENAIVAVRGLGGFHLCVNGCSESAVDLLRKRKHRPEKPLAIMIRDIDTVRYFCHLSDQEAEQLSSPEHPIVLLKKKESARLAANLAPGIGDLGVMLPYTPLHCLLFNQPHCPAALVMTSGNSSGDPICTGNEEALSRLGSIADFFLLHNRDIVTRVDDSVVKLIDNTPRMFRRARGYVPSPLHVPYELPEIIGCGGGLKSTFSLAREQTIFPSQHIGDLFNLASFDFFTESVDNLKRVFQIEPVAAACDLHPDYLSSRYGAELGLPLYKIQHHHAHGVAVMAEHALKDPVLAVILDGAGFGTDGTIWGGEVLLCELTSFRRLGSLEPVALPGGDSAAAEPWRMGLSFLHKLQGPRAAQSTILDTVDRQKRNMVVQMLASGFNSPLTSSCGRLFDALSAILGLNLVSSFEGQAAMQLEACAKKALTADWKKRLTHAVDEYRSHLLQQNNQEWKIISSEFIRKVVYDVSSGTNRPEIALQFHSWLIGTLSRLVSMLSEVTGIKKIVLSGGCLQNELLLEGLIFLLNELGLTPYSGSQIPVNDGG